MADYVGAIDQGTTSTRFMIFDHAGKVVAVDQKEHEQIFPKPGWVEHDPLEIMERTHEVIAGALKKAGISGNDLAAVGVTNQRETTIVWERSSGKPIHNALVWQDTRTDQICNELVGRRRPGPVPRGDGSSDRDLLLGAEDPVDPGQRRGSAGAGRGRRAAVRQHRHLGDLEHHRRPRRRRPRHRRDERQPHDADGPADPRLGRRDLGCDRSPSGGPARDPVVQPDVRRRDGRLGRHPGRG